MFRCCHGNQFVKSGSLVKNDQINKHDKKLKLLQLLTESICSFESPVSIYARHLWLLIESKNSYLCHVAKLITSSGSFQLTSNGKSTLMHLINVFDKALQELENALKSYL